MRRGPGWPVTAKLWLSLEAQHSKVWQWLQHHSVILLAVQDVFLFSPLAESLDVTGRGCLTQKPGQLSQLL